METFAEAARAGVEERTAAEGMARAKAARAASAVGGR